jgi:hypothetical protein
MVLQDLANELGRRLDYDVVNGRYQGVSGAVGFDGLWTSPEGHAIIAEIKTTDAYRVSLDTIAGYRDQLISAGTIGPESSVLIVVGRQDTGELEAQIRGSRHAWDVRLISAEALIKLVQLKENSDAPETGLKIRSLLTPVEYTRLDRMVDVMFTTATDVEAAAEVALQEDASAPENIVTPFVQRRSDSGPWQFTDSKELQAKRDHIVSALGAREGVHLLRKSRALYWSAARDVRAACAMSKRYEGKSQNAYWYAFHPQWDEFLGEAARSFFVLGCMDLEVAFAIPHEALRPVLASLNTTTRDAGSYWHIHLRERSGGLELVIPNSVERFPLKPFAVDLAKSN